MGALSIGKIRGLQQISNASGFILVCAMDHRGSMEHMLAEQLGRRPTYAEMVGRKLELCEALAPHSSAVLLDPVYGAAQCISAQVLPGDTGLLVSIEATGYEGASENRITTLLEGWHVDKIKRMGASAVKMLIYYRPDLDETSEAQRRTVSKVAEDCMRSDIPFLLEAVSYPAKHQVAGTAEFAAEKPGLVIDTARQLTVLPIDVLKAEFPADLRYEKDEGRLLDLCARLNEASRLPWVILSAGVDFDTFYRQVELACRSGASGYLGGRAVWQEAMLIDDATERRRYLKTTAADRLKRLADVAGQNAAPWYSKLGLHADALASVAERWYGEYTDSSAWAPPSA